MVRIFSFVGHIVFMFYIIILIFATELNILELIFDYVLIMFVRLKSGTL